MIISLGLFNSPKLKFVFVDGCQSSKYLDNASAYGAYSDYSMGAHDQLYVGWKEKILAASGVGELLVRSTTGITAFWEEMGKGKTIFDAFYYTTYGCGEHIATTLWGINGQIDQLPDGSDDDNIRWLGYGHPDGIRLEP